MAKKLNTEELENIRELLNREIKQTQTFINATQKDKYLAEKQKEKINEKHETRLEILQSTKSKINKLILK